METTMKSKVKIKKRISKAFDKKIYLLGKDKYGEFFWLGAPKWDCGWYWGFGYIQRYTNNKHPERARDISSHTHWDSSIIGKHERYDHEKGCFCLSSDYVHHLNNHPEVTETVLTDEESWTLAELMGSFYALSKTAEVLGRGGSHMTTNPCADIIKNEAEVKRINEVVLPAIFAEIDKLLIPSE